ncbi:hypothetical protein VSU19_19110 [Verrucomicrobiales bacterium BCK34]|nr:hypothetical protein [Verrucomicrobiales bacterium BCK34]
MSRSCILLFPLLLVLTQCSTAPVTKSAMGLQPVDSAQLVISRAEVQDGKLYVAGRLFSPLNTLNRAKVKRSGGTARITMTQAMLRVDGSPDFTAVVVLDSKINSVVIGKDRREIWNRSEGVKVQTSDTAGQTRRAINDLESRVEGVLRAFD